MRCTKAGLDTFSDALYSKHELVNSVIRFCTNQTQSGHSYFLRCVLQQTFRSKILYCTKCALFVSVSVSCLSSSYALHVRLGPQVVFDLLIVGPRDSHVSQIDFISDPNVQSIIARSGRHARHKVQVIMRHLHPVRPKYLKKKLLIKLHCAMCISPIMKRQ